MLSKKTFTWKHVALQVDFILAWICLHYSTFILASSNVFTILFVEMNDTVVDGIHRPSIYGIGRR